MAIGNGYQTGSANPGFYQNALNNLISNPSSFTGTPGYQFALNQALNATNAQNSTIRGSGNALAALQDRAAGLASQNYMDYAHLLGGLTGQEEQYDLGLGGLNNTAQSNANQLALGTEQNAINRLRTNNDFTLGLGQNANAAQRNANDFALGSAENANNFTLGMGRNANDAQRNWFDYNLGNQANTNQFNLGMFNAQTNRAGQEANAYNQGQNTLLNWTRFGYQLNPQQRFAGQPGAFAGGGPFQTDPLTHPDPFGYPGVG